MACKFGFKCSNEDSDLCKACNAKDAFKAVESRPFFLKRQYG